VYENSVFIVFQRKIERQAVESAASGGT
jgi:hypothetical protein